MAKFKVGDRVKILDPYPGHEKGDTGIIIEYELTDGTDLYLVEIHTDTDIIHWWYCDTSIEFDTSFDIIFSPAIYLYRAIHHSYIRSH